MAPRNSTVSLFRRLRILTIYERAPLRFYPRTLSTKFAIPQQSPSRRTPWHPTNGLIRPLSQAACSLKEASLSSTSASPSAAEPTIYDFASIRTLASSPDPKRIIIDVREPAELKASGHIPTAINIPLASSPDAMFLSAEEFEDRFGIPRPTVDGDVEVIFYCKAGVRSKAAARLAQQAGFGGKIGNYMGSWLDWEGKGGEVSKV